MKNTKEKIRRDKYRASNPWVTVQVQVPPGKERAVKGLAENLRSDYKREQAARAARGSDMPLVSPASPAS